LKKIRIETSLPHQKRHFSLLKKKDSVSETSKKEQLRSLSLLAKTLV